MEFTAPGLWGFWVEAFAFGLRAKPDRVLRLRDYRVP